MGKLQQIVNKRLSLMATVLFFAFTAMLLSSCEVNKSIMLQTPKDYQFATYNDSINNKENYRLAVADFISMQIYTNEGRSRLGIILDAAPPGGNNQITGTVTQNYVIDPDSTMNVPLLGRIKVCGLTIRETEELLEDKFSKFYNSPYIELRVTNRRFMVFVGGNAAHVVNMVNEKTTLIEGLALAGGIPQFTKAYNIKLIRGSLSNPTVYQIDMSTLEGAKMGGSMVLQANDIIYVEPVKRNFDLVMQRAITYLTAATSIFTLVFTISRL